MKVNAGDNKAGEIGIKCGALAKVCEEIHKTTLTRKKHSETQDRIENRK